MKTALRCMAVLLALVLLTGAVASCRSAVTTAGTPTPVASPTGAEVSRPTPIATQDEPTAAPTREPVDTPTSDDQFPRISVEELKELMDSGADITILDVRARELYQTGHIKGAISFPWQPQLTIGHLELLPLGKPLVLY